MKSSPKFNEVPTSTEIKASTSAKKLVQARLPFKTLADSEAPQTTLTNPLEAGLISANTLISSDTRKRKQSTPVSEDDGIPAPKQNRIAGDSGKDIINGSAEFSEIYDDLSTSAGTETGIKKTLGHGSESKENVFVDKSTTDEATISDCRKESEMYDRAPSKAKHSLDFAKEQLETRYSKQNVPGFMIKLSFNKKDKRTQKLKKAEASVPSTELSVKEVKPQEISIDSYSDDNVQSDENINANDVSVASAQEYDVHDDGVANDKEEETAAENEDFINVGDTSLLNDSIISNASDLGNSTPGRSKMTPKQMQKRLDSEKKKQEKERAKFERERLLQEEKEVRQREKEERELQKKRERYEKDEQRRKEKEIREQKQLEEKLEKQREKELKEQQRKIEREEKEEQRKREKEERDLQKKKEREEKEREKEEERKKKEEEKRQKIEAEQNKNRKTAEAFVKFFVPKKVETRFEANKNDEKMNVEQVRQTFMSFQVKEDMKLAPVTRRTMNSDERSDLENLIATNTPLPDLYLSQLRTDSFVPRKSARTWSDDEDDKCSNYDELFIMEEDGQSVQVIKEEPKKLYRAKFLKFAENRRPPYYGTWRKRSETVRPRKPFGLDKRLDYEVDSDEEWEEEEPGESLHGSDDEKEVESEDEYEIDNEFFVPHGHLSDEELQNEDESDFNDTENIKFKLKLAQNELENERKKKTQKLKPRLIGLIWQNCDGLKPENCSNGVWDLMNKNAMLFNEQSVKVERPNNQQDNSDDENMNKSLGVRRLQIGEKDIPDLIRLINGNQNKSKFLVKEFCAYLVKKHQPQREYVGASIRTKIKELATWQACPEEGRMFKKFCWYVPIQTRKRYGVSDSNFPNTWSYTLPPPRSVEISEVEGENKDVPRRFDVSDVIALSEDSNSNSCTLSETLTPELIKQASSKRTNYNIAKFIRPLTQDEKKKQFEPITLNRHQSEDQPLNDVPSILQVIDDKIISIHSIKRSKSKKRANILMSGPVGQELSPKLKTTLVTQFLSSNVGKRKSTDLNDDSMNNSSVNTAGTSDGAKKTKFNDSVIVID